MSERPRVGVSACLVGHRVRFSGGHCKDPILMRDVEPYVDLVPMCPEVEAGLGAPRDSLRLQGSSADPSLVNAKKGIDETPRLVAWSRRRVDALAEMELDGFVLKKASPTCGMRNVRVYQGPDAAPRTDGVGIFARQLLTRFPRLAVEEEGRLSDAGLREAFLTRVFASHRWRALVASDPDEHDLAAFHARNELLVLAHDPEADRDLRRILAGGRRDLDGALVKYGARFLDALARRATRARQRDVLGRLLDVAHGASAWQRRDLAVVIDEYGAGRLPLVVPARLLFHHVRDESEWAASQTWFAPWPDGILLRTTITHQAPRRQPKPPPAWHVARDALRASG